MITLKKLKDHKGKETVTNNIIKSNENLDPEFILYLQNCQSL